MGRPKLDNPRDIRVLVRVLPEERAAWREAADRAGLKLSAWIRKVANAAAKRTKAKS
jgi:hypothetical protein